MAYPLETQFVHIDWHHTGNLTNPSAAARATFYGASAAPDVYFDGIDHVLGAGDSISAYNLYKPRVDNHYLNDPSPMTVTTMADLNPVTMQGTVTVDLQIAPGDTILNAASVRAALIESDIFLNSPAEPHTGNRYWHHIGRLMIFQTPLTATLPGQTQHIVQNFPLTAGWNVDNCRVIAWVQRDAGNKKIFQAAMAPRNYDVNLVDLDPSVGSTGGGPWDFDSELTYAGALTSDVQLTLNEASLPAGWDAEIVWNSNTYPSTLTIPGMTLGQQENIAVRVTPSGAGLGTVGLTAQPTSAPPGVGSENRTYTLFSQSPAILFVDDDNGGTYQTKYQNAITAAGYVALTRTVQSGGVPSAAYMSLFDAVVWENGPTTSYSITTAAQTEIQNYLNSGGAFFYPSQGYLDLNGLTSLAQNYFKVTGWTDIGATSATGVPGDPIGDGLAFGLNPPFPNHTTAITLGPGGVAWLESGASDIAVRHDSGVYKTVFMAAAFEGIAAPNDALVMERVLEWLVPATTDVRPLPAPATGRLVLAQNAPNPFRGSTSVRFALPQAGPVGLAVYDVLGRKVADLANRPFEAGSHSVVWDGRDGSGKRAASGVYLVRLEAFGQTTSREMVRVE